MLTGFHSNSQEPYSYSINTMNGLQSNAIYCIMQDSKGFIWLSHDRGLSRFDGQEIKHYVAARQAYKGGSHIREDALGRIWYEAFDGSLYYVQQDSMHPLPAQVAPIGYSPFGFSDSNILVFSGRGIERYNLRTLKHNGCWRYDMSPYKSSYTTGKDLYAVFGDELLSVNNKEQLSISKMPKGSDVIKARGRLFTFNRISFDGWIYEIVNGEIVPFFHVPQLAFTQGVFFVDDKFWLCTTEGVWVYDYKGRSLYGNKPLFAGRNISGVCKDREGNFWFSTLDEGLLFVPDIDARITILHDAIPNAIARGKDKLYVATNKNEVYAYNPEAASARLLYKDSISHHVNNMVVDTLSNRLAVAAKVLNVFSDDLKKKLVIDNPVKEVAVLDSKYYAFSASGLAGLIKLRDNISSSWDNLFDGVVKQEGSGNVGVLLINSRFRAVLYNMRTGDLYYGGSPGLFRFTKHSVGNKELLCNDARISVAQLTMYHNTLVVLTTDNRLLMVERGDKVTAITIPGDIQLYKNYIIDGALHALSDKGLYRYEDYANKLVKSQLLSGISSNEIFDIHQYDSMLLVATSKGLITLPAYNEGEPASPLFYIEGIVINDTGRLRGNNIELNYTENNIEIQYTAPAYRHATRYPVLYKINNGEWVAMPNASRSLKLASLSPGSYTITFAQDVDDGNPQVAATVFINIRKPFWMTLWFITIVVLAAGVLIYLYYRWQIGLLKKQNQLLSEKVDLERNLHKSVLTAIRSQMNPHFFYNALNSIQAYIIADEKRSATAYLSKFSKLTRIILEMTGKETVTLQEEVNALSLYLDLEKVRFNNELRYTVTVAAGLDAETVKIPSMIVQPYVENSIKHGLLHKTGEKVLLIDFLRRDDNLCIVIDDNGIGRKKSMELNKIRADKHSSFSTHANMKRIEILNKGNNNIGVVYNDKIDAGTPCGTIVTITIPLIK